MKAMALKRRLFEIVCEPNFMDLNEYNVNVDLNTTLEKRKKRCRRKAHLASEVPVVHSKESKVHKRNDEVGNPKDEKNKHLHKKKHKHKNCNVETRDGMASHKISVPACVEEPESYSEEENILCTKKDRLQMKPKIKKKKECKVTTGESIVLHEIPVTTIEENMNMCTKDSLHLKHKKYKNKPIGLKHKESKSIYFAKSLHKSSAITKSEHEFVCPTCFKNFNNYSNFMRHLLIHRDVKDFSCYVCDKSFRIKQNLQVHMRIHMEEKPFECTECSACFSDANNLRRHVLIHNKVKEFVCGVCSKAFSMKHHLQKHILSHEDVKLFPCPHCSKVFNYEYRLRIHLDTCKKLNPIICSICSKQFPRVYNLNRHMRTHE